MCGIAGYFLSKPDRSASELLEAMQARLAHRGQDGAGRLEFAGGRVGLAHRRLAIVDLGASAAQPMVDASHGYALIFNGEIYNWRDIRARLEGLGHVFRTLSDTEVLLEGYKRWGEGVLDHLRGMFAFALWDERENVLFCARDRLGKKPFIYAEGPGGFVFGSEIPAILTGLGLAGVNAQIDAGALASMLLHNLRHIPDPATVYSNIRRLRAGHAMIVRSGRVERFWRYWSPVPAEPSAKSVDEARLRQIIEEAVDLRRMADVPVGALLSGGVDSTAIVALAQAHSAQPIRTYALGMDQDDEDLRRARLVAERLGTNHREFYFDPARQWDGFVKILRTYGEPIMLLPLVHTYELCTAIRDDGIKVVLSGNGADELFYGYTGMVQTNRLSRYVRSLEIFSPLARLLAPRFRSRPITVLANPRGRRKAALYRGYADALWPNILTDDALTAAHNYAAEEMELWGEIGPHQNYIDESAFAGLMVENSHSVTISADLPAMMAGVEMRAPFLDQEFVQAGLSIHWSDKLPENGDLTRLKKIFKSAVADLVPEEVLYAPKRGFGMGIQEKEVLLGGWREQAEQAFQASGILDEIIEKPAVIDLWRRGTEGLPTRWDLLAKLFAIQTWQMMH